MNKPYQGTNIEMVYASEPLDDKLKLAVGIVDKIAGEKFGWYADCGIVHTEEWSDNND